MTLRYLLDKIDFIFSWVRLVYPSMPSYKSYVLFLYVFKQKILLKNYFAKWPVHSTSTVFFANRVTVGLDSAPGMSQGNYIQGRNGITIGDNVRLGPGVGLISANHDPTNLNNWVEREPIEIGSNVWIGMNSVVLPSVKIGSNTIIGAGSVVTKDIPAGSVACGNPCVVIKSNSSSSAL